MSSQLNRRSPASHRRSAVQNQNPVFETRECRNEKLRLLKAPSVEAEAMWKAQSFTFSRNFLRGKLNAKASVDSVIAVIGDDLPMPNMTAGQEARRFISQFRALFGNVNNLTPTVFWIEKGKIRQVPCIINLDLPMCAIYE